MAESARDVRRGCLLVASPALLDPHFARSVVLVIHHDDEGSFGLILNRPLGRTLDELVDDVGAGAQDVRVCEGGPVQPEVLQLLGRTARVGRQVLEGVSLGADLAEFIAVGAELRGYLGYAGWSGGQLDRETAEGSWIIAPARAEHVFDVSADALWATVLRELGGRYTWLALGGEPESN